MMPTKKVGESWLKKISSIMVIGKNKRLNERQQKGSQKGSTMIEATLTSRLLMIICFICSVWVLLKMQQSDL